MKSKGKQRKKRGVPKYNVGGIGLAALVPGLVKSGIANQNDASGGSGDLPEEKPGVLGLLGSALGPLAGILGTVGSGMFLDWKQRNDYQALEQQKYKQLVQDKTVTANNGIFEMGGDPIKENQKPTKYYRVPQEVFNPFYFDKKLGIISTMDRYSTPDSYPYDAVTPYQADDLVRIFSNKTGVNDDGTAVRSPLADKIFMDRLNNMGRLKYNGMNFRKPGAIVREMEGGGYVKGNTYELTDAQIKKLKKQGFQLQYEED